MLHLKNYIQNNSHSKLKTHLKMIINLVNDFFFVCLFTFFSISLGYGREHQQRKYGVIVLSFKK